jgi:hypothetical protein
VDTVLVPGFVGLAGRESFVLIFSIAFIQVSRASTATRDWNSQRRPESHASQRHDDMELEDQNSASWNQLTAWLRQIEVLRRVA